MPSLIQLFRQISNLKNILKNSLSLHQKKKNQCNFKKEASITKLKNACYLKDIVNIFGTFFL